MIDTKNISQIAGLTWKKSMFIALLWLVIQYLLTTVILLLTVFDSAEHGNYLMSFSQFTLLLLSIMFPVSAGFLAAHFFPYNRAKKATRIGVGLVAGTIFGTTIGVLMFIFSTIVFHFASAIAGSLFSPTTVTISVETVNGLFSIYIGAVSEFVALPLTIIFGAIYGSIGGILRKLY